MRSKVKKTKETRENEVTRWLHKNLKKEISEI